MLNLDILNEKFTEANELTEDDVLTRELIELCSKNTISKKYTFGVVKDYQFNTFFKVYKEIFENKSHDDKAIVRDMINFERMEENILFIKQSQKFNPDDEEEIY